MRKEQAASGRVIGAFQEQPVKAKKEHAEERVARHLELSASVDAKVKVAVKEALAKVAEALEGTCCLERARSEGLRELWHSSLQCGHTYCNRRTCASSSVTACPGCRQPIGMRVPLFGALANVCELPPRDA